MQGQICGNYLGYIDVNQNSPVKLEECFQLPGAKKPMGLRYDGQFLIADTNPDNVKFTQIFPRTVLNAVDAQECKDYNCKIGDFFAGYTCKSKKDKTNVCNGGSFVDGENGLECKNGVEPCPPEYNLQLEYQLDNRSNIICADGWQPNPARYVLSDDPENKIFVETQNAFVSYQSKGPGEWERSDYPNIGLGLTKKFYIVQQELEQVDILLNLVD